MPRRRQPVLITSAADPRHVDIRRREGQYLIWMGFRVLCFVFAVLLFHGWARFVAILAALIIPWVAVVVANGGPAPSRRRPAGFIPSSRLPGAGPTALESGEHPVVDSDAVPGRGGDRPTGDDGPAPAGPEGTTDPGIGSEGHPWAKPTEAPPAPPPPRADVGFFGPRRPPRAARRR
ncbi:DUF3099 domain-containing protein [Frankia nepalensis]|uniref:DUF3099 domain-containing protein n=1 Tax=Frankia nepalensis TaxID=1836974 RepID=UPI0019324FA7|nr:DUF3099 domain-containing protein [Frankia nepalensis]MBL7512848.1 DUF3099 domain-containing protein [Frankia nepalensis]